jgi:Rrf2 family protein
MNGPVRVSEAASLALHAAALISGADGVRVSANTMADTLGASRAHLGKVLQRLVKAGLVKSSRGPGGGYVLARPPSEISLREVYEVVEGPMEVHRCLLGAPVCGRGSCPIGELVGKVSAEIAEAMGRMTLEDYTISAQPQGRA